MEKEFLTEKEASNLTGIAVQTLRNRRFEGRLPVYHKIGSSIRYAKTDLENFMKSHRVEPRQAV